MSVPFETAGVTVCVSPASTAGAILVVPKKVFIVADEFVAGLNTVEAVALIGTATSVNVYGVIFPFETAGIIV